MRPGKAMPDDDKPPDFLVEYDTAETIAAVAKALARRFRVLLIEADNKAYARLEQERPDLVFNISEGFSGPNREAHIPIICEMLGLAYTGSDGVTLGICLDKVRAKETLGFHKIPTPDFIACDDCQSAGRWKGLSLPAIVKPLREGSSKGIKNNSLVFNHRQLKARVAEMTKMYQQPALVEEFLPGREFTVGVLGNAPDFEVLPLVEINHRALPSGANPVYGYEAKWVWDRPDKPLNMLICPAKVARRLHDRIRALAIRAMTVLRVKDWCRIDLRLDAAGRPKIIELNPLPGILPDPRDNSALPAAARAAGYNYDDLILRVAQSAVKRRGL